MNEFEEDFPQTVPQPLMVESDEAETVSADLISDLEFPVNKQITFGLHADSATDLTEGVEVKESDNPYLFQHFFGK